jgi:hypothetical protein
MTDQADVLVHGRRPAPRRSVRDLLADLLAELLLFGVGHLQLADVVRLLGDRHALAQAAGQLSPSPARGATRPRRLAHGSSQCTQSSNRNHNRQIRIMLV